MAGRLDELGAGIDLGVPVVAARTAVVAPHWRDAVRAATTLLVEMDAATPHYGERCIAVVEEQGPYIVLAPGVAIAHARPEDGARRVGLTAVVLAAPVAFGHPHNDPVDVVLAFSSPDKDAHLALLASLADRLLAGLADALRAAGSDGAATALLEEVARHGT